MNKEQIEKLYLSVFPESSIRGSHGLFGGDELYFTAYLQKPEQWINSIRHNDPLNYMFSYSPVTGFYEEHHHSLTIKPTERGYAYGTAKLRKRNIKSCDEVKLLKRFNQVKQLVLDNIDNMAPE